MQTMKRMVVMAAVGLVALGGSSALAGGKARKTTTQMSGVLNLNTATAAQLDLLPGVGEKSAQRIIDYRRHSPFGRPADLVKVKGFGKKTYEKLKDHLAVSGPTTLKVQKVPVAQGRSGPASR